MSEHVDPYVKVAEIPQETNPDTGKVEMKLDGWKFGERYGLAPREGDLNLRHISGVPYLFVPKVKRNLLPADPTKIVWEFGDPPKPELPKPAVALRAVMGKTATEAQKDSVLDWLISIRRLHENL